MLLRKLIYPISEDLLEERQNERDKKNPDIAIEKITEKHNRGYLISDKQGDVINAMIKIYEEH